MPGLSTIILDLIPVGRNRLLEQASHPRSDCRISAVASYQSHHLCNMAETQLANRIDAICFDACSDETLSTNSMIPGSRRVATTDR